MFFSFVGLFLCCLFFVNHSVGLIQRIKSPAEIWLELSQAKIFKKLGENDEHLCDWNRLCWAGNRCLFS